MLCHMSEARDTGTALAIANTANPTRSPSGANWDDCPNAIHAPPPPTFPTPIPITATSPVPEAWLLVRPDRGSPGDIVTISGGNFPSLGGVPFIEFGGVSVLPRTFSQTGANGSFSTTLHIPHVGPNRHSVRVSLGNQTASVSFIVEPFESTATLHSGEPQPEGEPVASALASLGGNLLWIAHFDPQNRGWTVYDPSGTFSPDQLTLPGGQPPPSRSSIGSLTRLIPGGIYHLRVTTNADINGKPLYTGTNLLAWG